MALCDKRNIEKSQKLWKSIYIYIQCYFILCKHVKENFKQAKSSTTVIICCSQNEWQREFRSFCNRVVLELRSKQDCIPAVTKGSGSAVARVIPFQLCLPNFLRPGLRCAKEPLMYLSNRYKNSTILGMLF